MCGLYGFVGKPKHADKVAQLVCAMAVVSEERGTDSTGYVAASPDNYYIMRRVDRAGKVFTASMQAEIKMMIEEGVNVFIGHNRRASAGAVNAENCHPFQGDKYFLAHNGHAPEARRILAREGLTTKGDTDSEAILKIMEKRGNVEDNTDLLNEIDGYSLVLFDYQRGKDKVYFARDNYPLYVVDLRKSLGIRVFISTKDLLGKALKLMGVKAEKIEKVLNIGFPTKSGCLYELGVDGELNKLCQYRKEKPKTVYNDTSDWLADCGAPQEESKAYSGRQTYLFDAFGNYITQCSQRDWLRHARKHGLLH